jgi:imidazolonepropionase-like amidohydrolase
MAAAHGHGARVTAHCFASASLPDLVAAGIDCIEHATGLTEDLIPVFVEHQVAIVPTLVNIRQFPAIAEPAAAKYPAYQQHMIRLWQDRYRTVGAAREAGVPVYVGTDAGAVLPHGLIAQEVDELTRAGFPTMQAIGAATWDARAWLGRPGIAEGQDADLVVYPADPVADVTVMRYPRAVVLRGASY